MLDVSAHLPRMRAAAESLMVDTVTIREKTGTTNDPNTGEIVPTYADYYGPNVDTDDGRNGRARIQQRVDFPTVEQGASRTVTTLRLEVQLPISATEVKVDLEVIVNDSVNDPALVDRTFRVAGLHHKTHATSRRIMIEEVVT